MTNYYKSLQEKPQRLTKALAAQELQRRGIAVPDSQAAVNPPLIAADPDPVSWLEHNFYVPELMGPVKLAPYQKAALKEALRKDRHGNYIYSLIIWSDIKKSIKSTIAAGVALYIAYHSPWGSVKIIANDLDQADSRVNYYIRRAIELNPKMRQEITTRGYTTLLPNRAIIKAIPIDPEGEAGGNDDMVLYSELWGASGPKAERMWTESTLSPTKFGKSFRMVESYAGFTDESTILENLYRQTVKPEYQIQLPPLFLQPDHSSPPTNAQGKLLTHKSNLIKHTFEDLEVYANPGARMFTLWNTIPRLPWQTPEYYRQEMAAIPNPQEFNRVHRNAWASSTSKFVEDLQWDRCQVKSIPPLVTVTTSSTGVQATVVSPRDALLAPGAPTITPSDDPLIVGIDAAVTNDHFAISTISRLGDTAFIRATALWTPPPNRGEIDFSKPEFYLRRMTTPTDELVYDSESDKILNDPETGEPAYGWGLNVIYFVFDPFQMAEMSQRLDRQGVGKFLKLGQNGPRAESDSLLQKLILGTRIKHDGTHTQLTQHIRNANAKVTGNGKQIRLEKRNASLKIDLAVATSMACWIAFDINIG